MWRVWECLFRQLLLQCLMVHVINIASRQLRVIFFLCVCWCYSMSILLFNTWLTVRRQQLFVRLIAWIEHDSALFLYEVPSDLQKYVVEIICIAFFLSFTHTIINRQKSLNWQISIQSDEKNMHCVSFK